MPAPAPTREILSRAINGAGNNKCDQVDSQSPSNPTVGNAEATIFYNAQPLALLKLILPMTERLLI